MRMLVLRLFGQHCEAVLVREQVHPRALRELVGVLLAIVQHDDERQRPKRSSRRQVQRVGQVIHEAASRRRRRMIRSRPLAARPCRRPRPHPRIACRALAPARSDSRPWRPAPHRLSFDLTVRTRRLGGRAGPWPRGLLPPGRRGVSSRATRAWSGFSTSAGILHKLAIGRRVVFHASYCALHNNIKTAWQCTPIFYILGRLHAK